MIQMSSGVKFYTPPKLAKLLGVAPAKIIDLIEAGELVGFDVAGPKSKRRRWRISEAAFVQFQERRSVRPEKPKRQPKRSSTAKQFV